MAFHSSSTCELKKQTNQNCEWQRKNGGEVSQSHKLLTLRIEDAVESERFESKTTLTFYSHVTLGKSLNYYVRIYCILVYKMRKGERER